MIQFDMTINIVMWRFVVRTVTIRVAADKDGYCADKDGLCTDKGDHGIT